MTTYLGKRCSFGLLRVYFVNVYESVYVCFLPYLFLEWDVGFDCINS